MRVLQIDDNDDIRKFVGMTVSSIGHDYESADGGRKGVEMIENNQYDMVLLDMSMPEFSGIDVINDLSSKDLMKKQKIVIFSASVKKDDIIEELQGKGIHSFLPKPVDIDELIDKLTEIEEEIK